jgi:hypothetical protein
MKLNEDECRVINDYFEYLKHIRDTRILQNVHFVSDDEAELMSLFVAACLTIKKKEEAKTEDPFA